jgi:hypothetical protein
MPPDSLRILLAGLVDYAGLFPPAALPMREVAANYASYRGSPDAWALGRLIVPVTRLSELSDSLGGERPSWRVSALLGEDAPNDVSIIASWNAAMDGTLVVDTVELRASSAAVVPALAEQLRDFTTYVEFSLVDDPSPHLDAIARAGVRAKMRTGGVTPDAFPSATHIVRFLRGCAERNVPFKATAGLHHPLCNRYPLTYAPDAPMGEMLGFLNVFIAAAFARKGLPERELLHLIKERDPSSLEFSTDSIRWRDEEIGIQQLADARTSFAIAFGSCSFREPIDDLHQLGLL